jgi:hypothetical protein
MDPVWIEDGDHLVGVTGFKAAVDALDGGKCARLDWPVMAGEPVALAGTLQIIAPPPEPAPAPAPAAKKAKPKKPKAPEIVTGVHLEVFAEKNIVGSDPPWKLLTDENADAVCDASDPVLDALRAAEPAAVPALVKAERGEAAPARGQVPLVLVRGLGRDEEEAREARDAGGDRLGEAVRLVGRVRQAEGPAAVQQRRVSRAPARRARVAGRTDAEADGRRPAVLRLPRGGEWLVERPADVRIFSEAELKADHRRRNENVYVYDSERNESTLGWGTYYKDSAGEYRGIGHDGSNDLYHLLMKNEPPDRAPDVDKAHKALWGAMSYSEGNLDAINTWDAAFLSFGPIQQSSGRDATGGELQGALRKMQQGANASKGTELFDKYFGRHGLTVEVALTETPGYMATCYFEHGGKKLAGPREKEVLRDFIWSYRSRRAMRDPEFVKAFLRYGLNRPAVVLGISHTIMTKKITIGDVFKTDLGRALMLDTHVNSPGVLFEIKKTPPAWIQAALKVVKEEVLAALPEKDSIMNVQELEMLEHFMQIREARGVVQARLRAAKICLQLVGLVKDGKDNDELAKAIGWYRLQEKKPDPPAKPAAGAAISAAPVAAPGGAAPAAPAAAAASAKKATEKVMEKVGSVQLMRDAAETRVELRNFLSYTADSRSKEGMPGVEIPKPAASATYAAPATPAAR